MRYNLIMWYVVYLAVGSAALGLFIALIVILICHHYGVDMSKNLWVFSIPVFLSLFLNILFLELYDKFKKK
jgi:multisubunit Na+/H+ antiporter MnhE subunit